MNKINISNRMVEPIVALLCSVAVGLALLILTLENASIKPIAVMFAGIGFLAIVLYIGNLKHLLLAIIIIDMSSGIDIDFACNKTILMANCGFSISATLVALVVLYGLWVVDIRRDRKLAIRRQPKLGLIGWFLVSFVLACIISIFGARNPGISAYRLWLFLFLLALFFYLANNVSSKQDILFVVAMVALGLLMQLMIMEAQSLDVLSRDSLDKFLHRATGTFRSPNNAGAYLMQITLLLSCGLLLQIPKWQKGVLITLLFLGLANLIGTESRGAWTGFVIGGTVLLVGSAFKKKIDLRAIAVILLVAVLLVVFSSGAVVNRLTTDDRGAAEARGPLDQIALSMIRANPITGVGLNNFGSALHSYIGLEQFGAWLSTVHNGWLLIWSETGTLGFSLYFLFWLSTLWYAFRLYRRGHPVYGIVALGILGSVIGGGVHMLVEVYGSRLLYQIVWTNAALIMTMTRLQQQEDQQQTAASSEGEVSQRLAKSLNY